LSFGYNPYGDLELVVILMTSSSSSRMDFVRKIVAFLILEFLLVFLEEVLAFKFMKNLPYPILRF
jgi:hypothetical protein